MQVRTRRARAPRSWLVVPAVLAAVLSGCSDDSDPAPSNEGSTGSSETTELTKTDVRVLSGGSGSLLLWAADEQGYLEEQGLTMDLEEVLQFSTIIESLSSNQADAAPNAWVSVISAASAAPGPKVVMGTSQGFPVSLFVQPDVAKEHGITADGEFAELESLEGSNIRVSAGDVGEATYIWMTAVAKDAGLSAGPEPTNDIVLVPGAAGPPQLALWSQGQVDAIFIPNEFVASAGLSENVAVPVGQTAPIFEGIGGAGIVASQDLIENNPATVQALVNATYQGLGWLSDPANEDAVVEMMVSKLKMAEDSAAVFYDQYVAGLAAGEEICMTSEAFEGALALANAGRPEPISVPEEDAIDRTFCEEAANNLG